MSAAADGGDGTGGGGDLRVAGGEGGLPAGAQAMTLLGVDYQHLKTADGGDLYLTRHGQLFWRNLLPENWYASDWFKDQRRRLEGTSMVYHVPTRVVGGRSIDLVVKFSRVGEVVPVDTFTVNKFIEAEFNSPFEEFAVLMELREGSGGPRGIRIRTQRPLAIYVPSKRLQLWQTGRSEHKIAAKIAQHPGVEIDILRQYVVLFSWVKGQDAVETADSFDLQGEARTRFLSQVNSLVIHELEQKGYQVVDMKPQHVILRPRRGRQLLRDRNQQFVYALIDYELLQRTPAHEADVRSATRRFYLAHMAHRFDAPAARALPAHLRPVRLLGVNYVFGHAESTGGLLWVVGADPNLFYYFLPERWRRTPRQKLGAGRRVNYTCTKDDIHLVWRISRLGDTAQEGDGEPRRRAIEAHGYNSPFEKVALAFACARAGVRTIYPRAIYMTGTPRREESEVRDVRRYLRFAGLRTPDGEPVLRRDRDYISIYGYWNGPDEMLAADDAHRYQGIDGEAAVLAGAIGRATMERLMDDTRRRLAGGGLEALDLQPDHLLLSFDAGGRLVTEADGSPQVRLCNFELLRWAGGREAGWPDLAGPEAAVEVAHQGGQVDRLGEELEAAEAAGAGGDLGRPDRGC